MFFLFLFVNLVTAVAINETERNILEFVFNRWRSDYAFGALYTFTDDCRTLAFITCDAAGSIVFFQFRGTYIAPLSRFNTSVGFGLSKLVDIEISGTLIGK